MRIMVLGGGGCQLNLLRRLREQNDEIILVDYLYDCPGRTYADIHLPISTFDTLAVIRAARKYAVEGIVTTGTDQPVMTAAATAELLGLPFYIDSPTALAVTNKRVMKELFTRNGIPTLPYRLLSADFLDSEIKGFPFPAVLKPVDSQGQRGVFRVEGPAGVRSRIRDTLSYSREERALLEAYYENDEITVNGWADEGRATVLSVVDRVTMARGEHIGICLCHHFPSVHMRTYRDSIYQVTESIVSALGIRSGPLYFQYLIGRQGIMVNEIAMRIGGAYEDITLPIITGLDPLGMLIDYVKTGTCDAAGLRRYSLQDNRKFVSTQLFFCHPGRVARITPVGRIKSLPRVHDAYFAVREGDIISPIEDATARAGYFIVEGDSFAEMIERVNHVYSRMEVRDPQERDLLIRYEDYLDKYRFYTDRLD
ncbi:MAG: ATP-grasp domain-containing protein [Clostridiales bacterium]|nr:ATP-grasp domain-containing protein [Clostridiales bacterium]